MPTFLPAALVASGRERMASSDTQQDTIRWATEVTGDALSALANERRRTVLETLERRSSATPAELATRVAATEHDTSLAAVPADRRRVVERSLHHRHLPTLEDARLVNWTRDTVTLARRATVEVWEHLQALGTDALDWNELFSILESERCRAVLSTLAIGADRVERRAVATTVASADAFETASVDETEIELHHALLPKLERTDIVTYDANAGLVHVDGPIESVERIVASVAH